MRIRGTTEKITKEDTLQKHMKLLLASALLLMAACVVHAATGLKVNKDNLSISPPGEGQTVVIKGEPRCVMGAHPIEIAVYNRMGKNSSKGAVQENGSFSVSIQGYSKDKLLITFSAANGKMKKVKLTVPPQSIFPW
jgi:hypothetical protein